MRHSSKGNIPAHSDSTCKAWVGMRARHGRLMHIVHLWAAACLNWHQLLQRPAHPHWKGDI